MSIYSKNGARQAKVQHNKKVQKHIKGFYKTLATLDDVAKQIKESGIEITEDNIEIEAAKVIGRDIDSMEKFLLLGKLIKSDENI